MKKPYVLISNGIVVFVELLTEDQVKINNIRLKEYWGPNTYYKPK